jgi:hypothetical protein
MKMKLPLASGMFVFLGATACADPDPVEQLQGAWVNEGADCTQIFEKNGDRITFKDRSASLSLDSGIIILKNDKVKGPMGGCTISTTAEDGDQFSALLQCTDGLVSRDFNMSFRVIDETHFERLNDPMAPGATWAYTKCSL